MFEVLPWNAILGESLSTVDLLTTVTSFVKHKIIFSIQKRKLSKIDSSGRSSVLSLPSSIRLPWQFNEKFCDYSMWIEEECS